MRSGFQPRDRDRANKSMERSLLGFCLRVLLSLSCISYHVIMCIAFCIRVRLMHPSIFPVVRFAIRHSYVLRRPPLLSFREWVLNILGMDRVLPSGLGIAPVDRLSSFVPFRGRLILQRLTELARSPFCIAAQHPSKVAQKPILTPSILLVVRSRSHGQNRTSFGLS